MARTRSKNETEHLRGQIRELERQNRQLKKRLRALDKKAHLYEDLVEAVAEDIQVEATTKIRCEKCKDGEMKYNDFKHARFWICTNCHHREKA